MSCNNNKIIVLDDDKDILEYCRHILEDEGYQVFTDTTGKNIGELVQQHDPIAVIVDLYMPEMDGMETIFLLKTFYSGKIISLSSNRDMLSLTESITHARLVKPITEEALIAVVKSAGIIK